ncbi:probable RNA-binding protein 18 isoform X1 [Thunnus thynnus]|uniref:probable RNA-binding protein 18 isoform X1 n=1 Tax=Thunnus thynnus TaxID=8237 RepID=UPI003526DCBB
MSSAAESVENASIISESAAHEGNRLWIGNIDPKITEYHLVKLLEKFGNVKQFDFLFHKSGPLEGQPRGYCFVNFNTREEAERAIQCLNGKLALSKKLVVRWAHAQVRVSRILCWLVEMFGRWFLKGMSADVGCCSSAAPTRSSLIPEGVITSWTHRPCSHLALNASPHESPVTTCDWISLPVLYSNKYIHNFRSQRPNALLFLSGGRQQCTSCA